MIKDIALYMTIAVTGGSGVMYMENRYAHIEDVQVAESKADYLADVRIKWLVEEIAILERKHAKGLTDAEKDRLNKLRKQLEIAEQIRAGK